MELEQEKRRVLGLAFHLKRKRSRPNGSQGLSAKKSRACEDGSSGASSITSVDEEVSTCSSSSIDDEQVVELQKEGRDYADVADLFLRGLGVLLSDTSVEGIEKLSHSEQSRCAFEKQQAKMELSGGDANVQWAWYGADREEIDSIVEYGFRMAVPSSVGYCFAPIECSRISAVQAKVDEVGEQRLIFCQVVVGKVGVISSEDQNGDHGIDTGVYDLSNPKVLIIPAARFEPSRILSHHVVRFKLSDQWREIIESSTISGKPYPCSQQRKMKKNSSLPEAPMLDGSSKQALRSCRIMSFPTLFWILQSKIPQMNLSELQEKYSTFKNGELSKLEFIREVRRIAGDSLLYKCMCFIKLWSQGSEHAHQQRQHELSTLL